MFEVIFLVVLAISYLVVASVWDIRTREVYDWLSFSLIIFALAFRFFYSLFEMNDFAFFYQGIIWVGIFFILHNIFYYIHMFAGGDAKLMFALGSILPWSSSFLVNLEIVSVFLFLFLASGVIYGLLWSIFLSVKNFRGLKREFWKVMKISRERRLILFAASFGLLIMAIGLYQMQNYIFYFGILVFIFPYLYLYSKLVDEACMIKIVKPQELTEGDWLYRDVKIGKTIIKASWDGLDKKDILKLKKKGKDVKIRFGIPFVPVFLISFGILVYLWFSELFFGFI